MAEKHPEIEGYIVEAEKMLSDFDWKETVSQSLKFVKNGVGGFVNTTIDIVGNLVNSVVNFGIGFVFAIYILLQKEKLASQCKQFFYAVLKEEKADEVIRIGKLADRIFSSFLSGQVVEAIILGSMFFIAMSIFKFPYAMLVGVLIAVTALIPIFGAFIGCGLGAFMIFITDPKKAIFFVIVFLILQQLEGNLIYPHVVGGSVGLPSIWVLAAVSVGGSMMGVVGMLIFIPLVALLVSFWLGLPKSAATLAVVAFACPNGMNVVVFPASYGQDCKTGASIVLISCLGSILTVPVLYALLQYFFP